MTDATPAEGTPHADAEALIAAVEACDAARVEALLDAGASVNAKKEDGTTPLIKAVLLGQVELVRLLLERGADPSAQTPQGMSAAEWAEAARFVEIAALLKEHAGGEIERELLFPSTGTFRPVVPLSDVESPAGAQPSEATSDTYSALASPRRPNGHTAQGIYDEEEETTLVPARLRPAHTSLPSVPAYRPRPWIITLLTLALLLAAGLILEAARRNFRRAAQSRQTLPATQPREEEATALPTSTPPAKAPETVSEVVIESAEILSPPAVSSAASGGAESVAVSAPKPERLTAARAESTERPRASEAEPPTRRAPPARPAARAAAAPSNAISAPDSKPPRRNTREGERSSSRDDAPAGIQRPLPISTPPPDSKPRKVIQWP